MQLVFIDESGPLYNSYEAFEKGRYKRSIAKGPPYPSYPFFILAAVSFPESQHSTVDDWFRATKQAFFEVDPDETGPEYEIKGSLLYALRLGEQPSEWTPGKGRKRSYTEAQKKIWQALTVRQLEQLERSIFDLCWRIAPVVWALIVKQAHVYGRYLHKTWPPHYWALTYLQQRVAHFVQANHGAYQKALFIMDETGTLSTAAQFGEFLRTREVINGTASWPVDFRKYLVDVPVSSKSHLIQALQLADLVAHAVSRKVHKSDLLKWFDNIEPFLAKHWRTGKYENAGLTYLQ